MYDCNLIKSRAQKMQDFQLPSLESTYSYMQMPMTPGMPTFPMPILPKTPTTPMAPAVPISPTAPTTPAAPTTPRTTPIPNPLMPPRSEPTAPVYPTTPAAPTAPANPTVPAVPTTPARPVTPTFPPAPPEAEQGIQINPLLPKVLPASPNISVPPNPLLPPAYASILDYESLQYLNGYLRTQIGNNVEAEFLVGSSNMTIRYGKLIGVGLNYILIEDLITGDVNACDFYNLKFIRTHSLNPSSLK